MPRDRTSRRESDRRREALLHGLDRWWEPAMVVLGLVWLALLVVELVRGVSPRLLIISTAIWAVFIVDFLLRFALAPRKLDYLKGNWLTALALLLPALRVFRAARALRAIRGLRGVRLVRIVASVNRGMRAVGHAMRRHAGYVLIVTVLVTVAGAAGMYAFESAAEPRGFGTYWEALWWTAMLITTIGSEYWPQTTEGRILALMLSVYALAVLGYIAAALASFFIGSDAGQPGGEIAGDRSVRALRAEIDALRHEVRSLTERAADRPGPGEREGDAS